MSILLKREKVYCVCVELVSSPRNRSSEFVDQNVKAMDIVVSNVSYKYVELLSTENFAKEMWDAIETSFRETTVVRMLDLKNDFLK